MNADHSKWAEFEKKVPLYLFVTGLLICLSSCFTANTALNAQSKSKTALKEQYWKLIELNGNSLNAQSSSKETYMILRGTGNRIVGNGGCNAFSGKYQMPKPNSIRFSGVISTKMACDHMNYEYEFLNTLEVADSYSIRSDTLLLKKGNEEILARFVAKEIPKK